MPNAIGRVKLGEWCDQKASGPSISGLLDVILPSCDLAARWVPYGS